MSRKSVVSERDMHSSLSSELSVEKKAADNGFRYTLLAVQPNLKSQFKMSKFVPLQSYYHVSSRQRQQLLDNRFRRNRSQHNIRGLSSTRLLGHILRHLKPTMILLHDGSPWTAMHEPSFNEKSDTISIHAPKSGSLNPVIESAHFALKVRNLHDLWVTLHYLISRAVVPR